MSGTPAAHRIADDVYKAELRRLQTGGPPALGSW